MSESTETAKRTKWEPGYAAFGLAEHEEWKRLDGEEKQCYVNIERDIIRAFYAEVCRIAEENMLKTSKLEGSHYAAMKQLLEKYERQS